MQMEGLSSPVCWTKRPSFSDLDLGWGFNYSLSLTCLPQEMAELDSYGNETLCSDGSFCLSGNFKLTNNNISNCGSTMPPRGSVCSPAPSRSGQ